MVSNVTFFAWLLSVYLSASANWTSPPSDNACDEDGLASSMSLVQKQAKALGHARHSNLQIAHPTVSVCDFMLPLWHAAAEHLGQNGSSRCEFLEDFYQQSIPEGKPELTNEFHFPLYTLKQIVIWKCASQQIKANLKVAAEAVPDAGDPEQTENKSFSMVRDPMLHWVSGYSQIQFWAGHCHHENASFKDTANTTEAALAFVHDVLNMDLDPKCWVNNHIYSMLGPMHKYNTQQGEINFIGRLEQFNDDWPRVQRLVDTTFPPWQEGLAPHDQTDSTSGFPPRTAMEDTVMGLSSGAFVAMQALTYSNPKVALALGCSILLPDYVCLGYSNPVSHEDCVKAGFAKSTAAWKHITSKIKSTMCPQVHWESWT